MVAPATTTAYRSIWISDVHLGTKHAQAKVLLEFLRNTESQFLYLVGDFIDGWELTRTWHWEEDYNVIIQKLLRKNRKNTKVTYITGNHDEFLEKFIGSRFGRLKLKQETIHEGADGKRYLVIHGHQFDGLTHFNHILEKLGTRLYRYILDLNLYLNRIRRRMGFGYWSLASYLKYKAKTAVKFVTNYEESMMQMAKKRKVDGIICGHIHRPEIKKIGELEYLNCGDFVENCTALVEDFEGKIHLIHLHEDTVYSPGRGTRPHDTSHRDAGNTVLVGAPDRRSRRG